MLWLFTLLRFLTIPYSHAILDVAVIGHYIQNESSEKFQGVAQGGFSGLFYLDGADKLVALQDRPSENQLGPNYLTVFDINRQTQKNELIGFGRAGILELAGFPNVLKWEQFCDTEAIARSSKGEWFIASEGGHLNTHAEILRFNEKLQYEGKLPVVEFFRPLLGQGVRKNQSLESLAISPSAQFLYSANEMPLQQDLQNGRQSWLRLVRFRQGKSEGYFPEDWAYYQMQPDTGNGLVELVAYEERALLALERAFDPKKRKNTIRVFQVLYPPVGSILREEKATVLYKRMIVDLDDLKYQLPEGAKNLDNFEGMALGRVTGGKRELFLISDDNFSRSQKTILLGLLIPWPLPGEQEQVMNPIESKQGH